MERITSLEKQAELVAQWIQESKYLVVFTGAGISTESGLADFRGKDGLWTRRDKGLPPPKSKNFDEVEPNAAHKAIFKLQEMGIMKFLISQNVDNLHIRSGIRPEMIAELHGNYMIMKCIDCDVRFTREEIGWNREIHGRGARTEAPRNNQPKCPYCEGRIISSVVNFNDPMPIVETEDSKRHALMCDLMLVIGSSLSVFPAANYPKIAKTNGARLVIVNIDPTGLDHLADLKINEKAGIFMAAMMEKFR